MHLQSGETVVRRWREVDAAPLARHANDRDVWLGLRDLFPHPYALEHAHGFIAFATAMSPPTYLAIEVGGEVAGGIGYTLHQDVERIGAEVGYWLGRAFWGRGITTTALRLVTGHAFAAHPELRRLWAVPFARNLASVRVLEKCGYRCEGRLRQSAIKDGVVCDQLMFAMLRDDVDAILGHARSHGP